MLFLSLPFFGSVGRCDIVSDSSDASVDLVQHSYCILFFVMVRIITMQLFRKTSMQLYIRDYVHPYLISQAG